MKNLTELVFVLDKSGSMAGLEDDTIGGFNSMLDKQKSQEGDCNITTVLFSSRPTLIHDRINIKAVNHLTNNEYYVGGSTSLLDAIGMSIEKMVNVQKNTAEEYRADKVMFVIITDGYENSSVKYNSTSIKKLIKLEKEKYNWQFIFLGATLDAEETAEEYGIDNSYAASYVNDKEGTNLNYSTINNTIASFRKGKAIDKDSLSAIREYRRKKSIH